MRARYIKIILWASALVGVWELGRSDAATNALFLFATVGLIPGTDKTLAPQQVFVALGVFLVLMVLLIFSTNIVRGVRRLVGRGAAVGPEHPAVPQGPIVAAPQPSAVVVAIPAPPGRVRLAWRRLRGLLYVGAVLVFSG